MAIGKVNAYATVEAPKADFGAVAQLNIDNLVKSAKEDEQLKAAKKAAEAKSKQERAKDVALFPELTATSAVGLDSFNLKVAREKLAEYSQYTRDWVDNGNYESKAKAEALVGFYKNTNKQLELFKDRAVAFSTAAGKGEIYSKDKENTMNILKSSENGLVKFNLDGDGNVKVGVYKKNDSGEAELSKVLDYNEWYDGVNKPIQNIKVTDMAIKAKGAFERSLTENFPGLVKTGIKELSKEAKDQIYKMALSETEDDQFMYVAGDKYNVIGKDDFKKTGFDPKDKEKVARAYADEIIGMFGRDVTKDKIQPRADSGDGTKTTFTPSTTKLTDADFYGNTNENGEQLDNYSRDAKSMVLTGISGTDEKSKRFVIPSFAKWSADNPEKKAKQTDEIMTDFVVTDLIYDRAGRPIVRGNYINTKSTTYKAALLDATQRLMKQREELKSGETDEEINTKAKLALNSEAYDIERENHVQAIGKVAEENLATYMKGKTLNGIRIKDVPSMRKAMGYNKAASTFDAEAFYKANAKK